MTQLYISNAYGIAGTSPRAIAEAITKLKVKEGLWIEESRISPEVSAIDGKLEALVQLSSIEFRAIYSVKYQTAKGQEYSRLYNTTIRPLELVDEK